MERVEIRKMNQPEEADIYEEEKRYVDYLIETIEFYIKTYKVIIFCDSGEKSNHLWALFEDKGLVDEGLSNMKILNIDELDYDKEKDGVQHFIFHALE